MLMEAIVAINLVLIGLLGIISLLVKSSHTNRDLGTSLTATYLAAEGMEIIKNIIDADVAERGIVWNASVETNSTYKVDYLTAGGELGDKKLGSGDMGPFLNIDQQDDRHYTYKSGTPTIFKRKVKVSAVSGNYEVAADVMRIESFVSIGSAICDESSAQEQKGCVRIQDEFYNWRRGTIK